MTLAQASVSTFDGDPLTAAMVVLPLFALAVISVPGLPVLLIAKWGRWRLLFTVLAPMTSVSVALTFAATLIRDRLARTEASPYAAFDSRAAFEFGCYVGVGLSIGLLLTCVVVAIAGLADKRRWGLLACLVGAPIALLAARYLTQVRSVPDHRVQTVLEAPAAEVASDAELLAVVAAEPSIPLDDAGESETPTRQEAAIALKKVPDWVTADPGPGQEVLTTGPILSRNQCINEATNEHLAWVWQRMREQRPDLNLEEDAIALPRHTRPAEVVSRFMVASSLERRSTSVGEVYFQHILARARDADVAWLAERLTNRAAEPRRPTGLRVVALGGGALVGLVGLLHLLLRDGETPPAEGEA